MNSDKNGTFRIRHSTYLFQRPGLGILVPPFFADMVSGVHITILTLWQVMMLKNMARILEVLTLVEWFISNDCHRLRILRLVPSPQLFWNFQALSPRLRLSIVAKNTAATAFWEEEANIYNSKINLILALSNNFEKKEELVHYFKTNLIMSIWDFKHSIQLNL